MYESRGSGDGVEEPLGIPMEGGDGGEYGVGGIH